MSSSATRSARVVLGLALLCAAALKIYDVSAKRPDAAMPLLAGSTAVQAVATIEVLAALSFATRYWWLGCWTTVALTVLGNYLLAQSLEMGRPSCGCLGRVTPSPEAHVLLSASLFIPAFLLLWSKVRASPRK